METSEVSVTNNIFTDNLNWQVSEVQASLMYFQSTVEVEADSDLFYVNTQEELESEQTT